jgi:K(+)-stimulated pyrophosphate-energized sodium pump
VTVSFVTGALCSAIAGYIGMFVSIRANLRTAAAAMTSLDKALRIALRGGAVSGLAVVSMSLLGVGGLFYFFGGLQDYEHVPLQIVGFGFGASFVALFAQLGGGIYTKAADVGADLVGKVEAGIPEDDPRNPAVIADLVGDNVGDCAGRGADLFESTAAENVGRDDPGHRALPGLRHGRDRVPAAGAGLRPDRHHRRRLRRALPRGRRPDERPEPRLPGHHRPGHDRLRGGGVPVLRPLPSATVHQGYLLGAGIIGIMTAYAFVWITQYYTEYKYRPVRSIAEASKTGPATNIIAGLAVGMECTGLPVLVISAALLGAYWCGTMALGDIPGAGLYGTAIATMGMLAPCAYILAMDTFGPITDNAGGIIEMSKQPERSAARRTGWTPWATPPRPDQGLRHRLRGRWPRSCSSARTWTRSARSRRPHGRGPDQGPRASSEGCSGPPSSSSSAPWPSRRWEGGAGRDRGGCAGSSRRGRGSWRHGEAGLAPAAWTS